MQVNQEAKQALPESAPTMRHLRKPSRLPAEARKLVLAHARQFNKEYSGLFQQTPGLRCVVGRLYLAGLQPRRRAGRRCDPRITRAAMLFRRLCKKYPVESPTQIWDRVYRRVVPGFDGLTAREKSKTASNLRAAVRSRRNARRRRARLMAKQ
jgi:hypothetical protein